MTSFILVFVGAGLGGVARHAANLVALRLIGPSFPWGTLCVNVVGSVAMGLLAGYLASRVGEAWVQGARLLLATGLLGGFTTFSAFSLDAIMLIERGEWLAAGAYVAGSVALSLAGLVGGLALMRALA